MVELGAARRGGGRRASLSGGRVRAEGMCGLVGACVSETRTGCLCEESVSVGSGYCTAWMVL
eukprot:5329138-Alexandrium_andersonii.AAC.1